MNYSSSSSAKTRKQKCSLSTAPAPVPEKIERGTQKLKKMKRKQSSPRNPLQDLNTGIASGSSSNASSISSIEAPKGCLRFFLSNHSSSSTSKTPFSSGRPIKSVSKTPKSAPNARPLKPSKDKSLLKCKDLEKPISHSVKKNPPCLYQWQSGRKPSSKNAQKSKNCAVLNYSGRPVNFLASGSGEMKPLVGGTGGIGVNVTPLSKVANGSGLGCEGDRVLDYEKSNTNTSSNAKTPPVQASVSPEIQCGSSLVSATATITTTPACYGAGHVVSGVIDKRKCRPRGILTVGDNNDLFGKPKAFGSFDSDIEEDHGGRIVIDASVSTVPLPVEASMQWLLSPCNEEDEDQKENLERGSCRFQRVEGNASPDYPSLPFSGIQFSPDICYDGNNRSPATNCSRRKSDSFIFMSQLPELQERLGDNVLALPSPFAMPSHESAAPEIKGKYSHDIDGENSPFSMDSLGSENVIRTPHSDSSSDRCAGLSQFTTDDCKGRHYFDSDVDLLAEGLLMSSLSPKSHVSVWDPINSVFQVDCTTTPSNYFDISQLQKILDERESCISNSTSENVSQSQMRISWREGLHSRIFEMDEFDSCRCLSDEEEDANDCGKDQLQSCQSPELNMDISNDNLLANGFGLKEILDNEQVIDGKVEERHSPQIPHSCAESISTDGGGLVCSEDSDWSLCYKNQLFQV